MYNYELSDDALKTWMRLRQASDAVEKVLQKDLDSHDSTITQVGFLWILDACRGSVNPGQFAKYHFREQHSVSAQLSRMWRNGLVKKTRSKADQRVVSIKMTPKGEKLLKEARQVGIGQARELLASALSDAEIKQLDKLLKKVRDTALDRLEQKAERLPSSFDIARFEGDLN
ncbi:MarR family winged helix-turn-helix transcriptional regulator [Chloroflexota bacterium]